jgi:glucose-1-phosphate thymidylyltransferase
MLNRKGIILAGGAGTRLYPLTVAISKQLLPVYDKPMIYYPLSVLMLAGIREVAIITTPEDQWQFKRLLRDGSQWGMQLEYIIQPSPAGLAQAYILTECFLGGATSLMVLGDNIFFGHGLAEVLHQAAKTERGGTVFGYHVIDPERYGVVGFGQDGTVNEIVEKPVSPLSSYAVTGLYFLDGEASKRAKSLKPSKRGQLEITSLLESYLKDGTLSVEIMGRGIAWFDAGTHSSLLDAANFVRTLALRQGLQAGCPEEIAYRAGWIDDEKMEEHAVALGKTDYGAYLASILESQKYS